MFSHLNLFLVVRLLRYRVQLPFHFRCLYSTFHFGWSKWSNVKFSVILPSFHFMGLNGPFKWVFVEYCVKVFFSDLQSSAPLICPSSVFVVYCCTHSSLLTCQGLHYSMKLPSSSIFCRSLSISCHLTQPAPLVFTCTPFTAPLFLVWLFLNVYFRASFLRLFCRNAK